MRQQFPEDSLARPRYGAPAALHHPAAQNIKIDIVVKAKVAKQKETAHTIPIPLSMAVKTSLMTFL
jgi:hypothetical protein